MKIGLRIRLLGFLSIILVISFLAVSYFNFVSARNSLRQEIITSGLPLTRENIFSDIQASIIPPLNISSSMANDTFLIEWIKSGEKNISELESYLKNISEKYGYFSVFFVSDKTSFYYYPDGILKKINKTDPHDVWYFDFVASNLEYDLDVDTNQAADDALTIFVNYRLEDLSGRFLGVTGVGIKMADFQSLLDQTKTKYNREVFLTDPAGIIQAHSQMEIIDKKSIHDMEGISAISGKLLNPGNKSVDEMYKTGKNTILVTSRYIPEIDWYLFVEQNETAATRGIRKNLVLTLLVGFSASIVIIFACFLAINFFQKKIEYMAVTDPLTGTGNRREFETIFIKASYRFRRYQIPFSLVMLDLDNFKYINDNIGHLTGDRVLKELTDLIKSNIRPSDHLARFGGDEFIILMECPEPEAVHRCKQIVELVATNEFNSGISPIHITISMGVAGFATEDTFETNLARADRALYEAKENGRNRVCRNIQ